MIVTLALLAMLGPGAVAHQPGSATVITGGFASAYFVRFSPDGRELVRVNLFGPAMLFDTGNYNKARTFPVELRMVAYSPDGSRIATAEGRDGARVWDSALQGKPIPTGLPGGKLPDAKPIPAGLPLDLRGMDTPLQVLQAPSGDSSVRVFWAEFSPDGQHLVTTHANGHVKIWNASSWQLEADLALTHREVRAATFSPDSASLVIGDVEGELHRFSLASKTEGKTTRTTLGAVAGITFSPDGKTLVTSHQSASSRGVMIWNTDTWTAVTRQGFGSAAFSQDGKLLALGGDGIELIDPRSQKEIRTIELPRMTLREALGRPERPNGDAKHPFDALPPGADRKVPMSVDALAFSPDGRTLAAGCKDGTVRLVQMNPEQ